MFTVLSSDGGPLVGRGAVTDCSVGMTLPTVTMGETLAAVDVSDSGVAVEMVVDAGDVTGVDGWSDADSEVVGEGWIEGDCEEALVVTVVDGEIGGTSVIGMLEEADGKAPVMDGEIAIRELADEKALVVTVAAPPGGVAEGVKTVAEVLTIWMTEAEVVGVTVECWNESLVLTKPVVLPSSAVSRGVVKVSSIIGKHNSHIFLATCIAKLALQTSEDRSDVSYSVHVYS